MTDTKPTLPTKGELLERLEYLTLQELVARLESGKATSAEIGTATQLASKAGVLTRTAQAGRSGDEWLDMVMAMGDAEFESFFASLREQRAESGKGK